jgi:hypothetical protein
VVSRETRTPTEWEIANPITRGDSSLTPFEIVSRNTRETRSGDIGSGYIVPSYPGGGAASSGALNSVAAAAPREWQIANIAAIGTVVPIVYGIDQIGARYLGGVDQGSTVFLSVMWCEECVGVQALYNNSGDALSQSIAVRHYDGSQTLPDTRLKAAYQAKGQPFDDALHGTCYSVFEFQPTSDIEPSGIIATIKGFRVFDPRDTSQSLTDKTTWKWSDNAALCLADFLSSESHGYGKSVDWASVEDAADFCDEILGSGSNQQKRRTVNWALTERMEITQIIEALRTYAGCIVVTDYSEDETRLRLIPDRVVSTPAHALVASDLNAVPRIRRRGTRETPTVIRCVYTNATNNPYKQEDVYDPDPLEDGWEDVDIVESTVNLPGINNRSAAKREARERRLKFMLGDLDISASIKDIGVLVKAGDVISITHPVFPEGKLFRVKNTPTLTGYARYQIDCGEYQPQMYCDEVFPSPEYPDTTLPDPSDIPSITNLAAEERLVQYADGTVASRIVANWQPPEWPYSIEYFIELMESGELVVPLQTVYSAEYSSPGVEEGKHYVLRVAAKCRGFVGPWSAVDIIALGKYLPPTDVPRFIEAIELNGTVYLAWQPAIDIDVIRYEIRRSVDLGYDLNNLDSEQADLLWCMGTMVNLVDAVRVALPLQPPATWIYMVKALDTVGNYSLSPRCVRITVTLDNNSRFVDEWDLGVIDCENVSAWSRHPEHVPCYTTDHGDSIGYGHADPNDTTGTFADLAALPFAVPHSSGESYALTHITDVGQSLAGNWIATANVADHDGAHRMVIELSDDTITWAQHDGAFGEAAALAKARYARVRVESDGTFTLSGAANLKFAVFPREATGEILVGATGTYVVVVPGLWASYVDVSVEYIGLDGKMAVRGDVIINNGIPQFEVQVRDADGRATGRVQWRFKGV